MFESQKFELGDILFLTHEIAGIPYPSGFWVLCAVSPARAEIALVIRDMRGRYAINHRYDISTEDFSAFSATGEKARLTKWAD